MENKLLKSFALGTTLLTAGAATIFLKHKVDSEKAISLVKETIDSDKEVVSSWVEPLYQKVNIEGTNKYCLVGGINIMENFEIIQYHFLVDAFSGELIDIKKTN